MNSYEDIPDFSGRLVALFNAYIVFWAASIHLAFWVQEDTTKIIWKMLIGTTQEEFRGLFRKNFVENLVTNVILLGSL